MIEFSTRFTHALRPEEAACELADGVESVMGSADRIGGGFLFSTAASGHSALEIGRSLGERWPNATLMGSSFEGVLADGQVWRDEPAAALLVWSRGPAEPIPLVFEPSLVATEQLADDLLEEAGSSCFDGQDLLLLFPDALASSGLETMLAEFVPRLGEPSVVGAAAIGLAGGASLAWFGSEQHPAATVGLLVPGGATEGGCRVRCAGASRFASPWLEISACRERWIDGLEGEPALDWVRRQLDVDAGGAVEPHLDRLLVRLRDESAEREPADRMPAVESSADGAGEFVERYVVGIDERRGSISVPGVLRRGGHLAFALPDSERAREALREAVRALMPSPLLLQFACRARDETLHGDADLESALVAHAARERSALGTLGPFQLYPDAQGLCRVLVHSTVLAALGDL